MTRYHIPAIVSILLCLSLLTLSSHAASLPPSADQAVQTANLFTAIIEKTRPGVVFIDVKSRNSAAAAGSNKGKSFFDDPDIQRFFNAEKDSYAPSGMAPETTSHNRGSGFIISPDGYILTNAHVIKNAVEVAVTLTDRRHYPAKVIGADARSDVGLIKIEAESLATIPLGSSEQLKTGEWVLAFGSPYESIQSVTAGIISATGRNSLGISDYEDYIQTDAAINPGNSGGPLVNIRGEVIGINTAFITQTGGYMGVGFAVPVDMAKNVSEQLRAYGKITRAWLGVALKDAGYDDLEKQKLEPATHAVRIIEIQEKSPAAGTDLGE